MHLLSKTIVLLDKLLCMLSNFEGLFLNLKENLGKTIQRYLQVDCVKYFRYYVKEYFLYPVTVTDDNLF